MVSNGALLKLCLFIMDSLFLFYWPVFFFKKVLFPRIGVSRVLISDNGTHFIEHKFEGVHYIYKVEDTRRQRKVKPPFCISQIHLSATLSRLH